MNNLLITLGSGSIGVIIGVLLKQYLDKQETIRQLRFDCLHTLFTNKGVIVPGHSGGDEAEFNMAYNSIPLLFCHNKTIMLCLSEESTPKTFAKMMKEALRITGLKPTAVNENILTSHYNVNIKKEE